MLRVSGWHTLVIWECQLAKPELVSRRLATFLSD
jgi:G:T-mismatch repair DNA endonuclease (very short patch repair protein)